MDLDKYQELAGVTVAEARQAVVTATISRAQSILESMLGFTLTLADVADNQYIELGKTATDCPCPDTVNVDALLPADDVVFAYRLFNYNIKDKLLSIDPCTVASFVKLVKDGVTFYTLDSDDYIVHYKNGIAKYIELCDACYSCAVSCECTQMAVDATWVWDVENDIPKDLLYVWSDMVTYYSDPKLGVTRETLGPHSYTIAEAEVPEAIKTNLAVIKKYSGPNGSLHRVFTV